MSNESAESLPESSTTAATAENNNIQGEANSDGPLTPFYEQLLNVSFPDSVTAIEHCRDLCAQFGFTVKQEASTHRNIYVYCSREGLPDSLRNPKANPKRKRPSKRCDCRWRVVLYESNGHWEFRKSLNPDAAKHNHELMRPEDIDRNWPKKVIDLIYELARTNLPTSDIRSKVQQEFPHISWNERRFYNRLSEERQKIKHREAAVRARHLTEVWSRVCMAAAGNEELSGYVENEITKVLYQTCQMAKLDSNSLHSPMFAGEQQEEQQQQQNESQLTSISEASSSNTPELSSLGSIDMTPSPLATAGKKAPGGSNRGQRKGSQSKQKTSRATGPAAMTTATTFPTTTTAMTMASSIVSKPPDPPKGFTTVVIPQATYFVKIHSQRVANEIQLTRNPRRSRSISASEEAISNSSDIIPPARKLSRRSTGTNAYPGQQTIRPAPPHQQHHQSSSPDINVITRMQHSSIPSSVQHQQQHTEQQRPSMLDAQHQQQQQQSSTNFVYHTGYDNQGIPIQSTIPGYEFHRFHQSYNMSSTTPQGSQQATGGFAPPPPPPSGQDQAHDNTMQSFNPSNSVVRTTNEPTIHPALQSNPVTTHRPPPTATMRRDSVQGMYPSLVSAPGVYQLAAAAAVVTSREEEMRQQQQQQQQQQESPPQQQNQQEVIDSRDRNIYLHQHSEQHQQQQQNNAIIASYQASHAPDTPMPGREHHDSESSH
ncbi:hypothetical protein BDC45DRAFT_603731 [Circinella umbellata]|nr:hypothetical protein BDC45DRAFT_603731 [Circinella umbellata]